MVLLLDWGLFDKNAAFRNTLIKEIFTDKVYTKFFDVEENDVVLDVGASIGPFACSILPKQPKKLYCLEPHEKLYYTLRSNVEPLSVKYDTEVFLINAGISAVDGEATFDGVYDESNTTLNWTDHVTVNKSITLQNLVEQYNIEHIDFLKTDCEGGEYDIFTEHNLEWVEQNVKKVAGEFHLHYPKYKEKFVEFRDTYLKHFSNHKVLSMSLEDITDTIWTDEFVQNTMAVNLFIDNRN